MQCIFNICRKIVLNCFYLWKLPKNAKVTLFLNWRFVSNLKKNYSNAIPNFGDFNSITTWEICSTIISGRCRSIKNLSAPKWFWSNDINWITRWEICITRIFNRCRSHKNLAALKWFWSTD